MLFRSVVALTVTLSEPSTAPISIAWTTLDGSATAGEDYAGASGTVSFAPGDTTAQILLVVNGDMAFEGDETFRVRLSAAQGAILADDIGVVTVVNDDAATLPTIRVGDVTISEGDSGTTSATFTLQLSAAAASAVTVDFATGDGTALGGEEIGRAHV